MNLQLPTLFSFLTKYFSHPFWRDAQIDDPWIRVAFARSERQKILLKERGKNPKGWFIDSRVYKRSEFGTVTEPGKAADEIRFFNAKYSHCYYYPNVSPYDLKLEEGVQCRDKDITNILYLCVDYDFPLPLGFNTILSNFGVTPWVAMNTSVVAGIKKYQALIALGVEEGRDIRGARGVGREICNALSADIAVSNPATLMRLPGSYNWKGALAEGETGAGYCLLLKAGAHSLNGKVLDAVYSLERLMDAARSFRSKEIYRDLQSAAPKRSEDDSAAVGKGAKGRDDKLWSGRGFRRALRLLREKGEISARKGERHTALLSWAGELAGEIGGGKFGLETARELLCELAHGACEAGFSGEGEERELRGLLNFLEECWSRDKEARELQLRELLEELGKESREIRAEGREGREGLQVEIVETGKARSEIESWIKSVEMWVGFLCAPTESEKKEIEKVNLDDTVNLASALSDSKWLVFLSEWLCAFNEVSASSGMTREIVDLLLKRIEVVGGVHGPVLCIPNRGINVWDEKVRFLSPLIDIKQRNYLFSYALQEMCVVCEEWRDYLVEMPLIKGLIEHIRREARKECTRIDERGEEIVDEKKVLGVVSERVRGLLRPVLGMTAKKNWVAELESGCHTLALMNVKDDAGDYKVVYQNGIYDLETGKWIEDGEAWRRGINVLWSRFNVGFARDIIKGLREYEERGELGRGLAEVLECECPLMYQFLIDAFPEDYETWVIVFCIIGYVGLGCNPFQVCFNFHGITRTGKTTLATLITELVGRSNSVSMEYTGFSREYEGLIRAVGKLCVFVDEAESSDKRDHERVLRSLKKITSDKPIDVRGIYKAAIEARIYAKVVMTTNQALQYEDTSGALSRRMVVLKFAHQAPVNIPYFERRILEREGEKIATLGGVMCRFRWGKGREMFESVGSVARREGSAELVAATDKLRSALETYFRFGVPESEGGATLPLGFLTRCVQYLTGEADGNVAVNRSKAAELAFKNTLQVMNVSLGNYIKKTSVRCDGAVCEITLMTGVKIEKELFNVIELSEVIESLGKRYIKWFSVQENKLEKAFYGHLNTALLLSK